MSFLEYLDEFVQVLWRPGYAFSANQVLIDSSWLGEFMSNDILLWILDFNSGMKAYM